MSTLDSWPEWTPNEILPGLFQGGTDDLDLVMFGSWRRWSEQYPFDVVVTLYADANPVPWGVEEIRFGFLDADLSTSDARRVVQIARDAHLRWVQGDRVLIRCQAGVNRSGLVTALVLMLAGYQPADAIEHIRSRRSRRALSNGHFETWLITSANDAINSQPTAA